MAKLTGRLIWDEYSPGRKKNSFYEEMKIENTEWAEEAAEASPMVIDELEKQLSPQPKQG